MHENVSPSLHLWNRCHGCGAQPIVGPRFECQTCPMGPDNDLCEPCHSAFEQGTIEHPLPGGVSAAAAPRTHRFHRIEASDSEEYRRWLDVPTPPPEKAPAIPEGMVVRPEFCWGQESFLGGYAVVVRVDDSRPPVVITALHVMDELLKQKGINCSCANPNAELNRLAGGVRCVHLYDVFARNWMRAKLGSTQGMLPLAHACVGETEPYCQRDIAAFVAADVPRLVPAVLAARSAREGEQVWLAVNVNGLGTSRTLAAVVVQASERSMIFRYLDPEPGPHYSSGAPLLNRAGEVVGINIGRGVLEGNRLGHAVHAESIRRHLAAPPDTPV